MGKWEGDPGGMQLGFASNSVQYPEETPLPPAQNSHLYSEYLPN